MLQVEWPCHLTAAHRPGFFTFTQLKHRPDFVAAVDAL